MRCSPLGSRYEIPDTQMADEKQLEILQDKANFRSFRPKPFNMREFYDRAGHDIRDMLLSCHFRGEVCSAEDFKVVSESPGWCGTGVSRSWRRRRLGPGRPLGRKLYVPRVPFWQKRSLFCSGVHLLFVTASALCP